MVKGSIVVCELPKSGLGNQLFPLMKALVFGHLNNLPVIVIGYHTIKLGPYLRGEKSKRKYSDYFTFQRTPVGEFFDRVKVGRLKKTLEVVGNPPLEVLNTDSEFLAVFTGRIKHDDFFEELKKHRQLVRQIFWNSLSQKIKNQLSLIAHPTVGIHIRMGDFRKLQDGQEFRSVGGVRTPQEYFVSVIESIRRIHGSILPVSVFSDGYRHELRGILRLPNVELIEGNPDMTDLLLLAKSKIIVASAGSTFSYWAGFLSDAPLILHPDHIHQAIREPNSGSLYEGPFDVDHLLLKSQITQIPINGFTH